MIYIVEDDAEIRELEVYALKSSGFESKSFDSGKNLDEEIKVQVPDLFILDIMLPGEDGLSILKTPPRTGKHQERPHHHAHRQEPRRIRVRFRLHVPRPYDAP